MIPKTTPRLRINELPLHQASTKVTKAKSELRKRNFARSHVSPSLGRTTTVSVTPSSRWGPKPHRNKQRSQSEAFFFQKTRRFFLFHHLSHEISESSGFYFFHGKCWLFNSDPHNGLILSPHNWVVFSSQIYPKIQEYFFIAHLCLRSLKLTATKSQVRP